MVDIVLSCQAIHKYSANCQQHNLLKAFPLSHSWKGKWMQVWSIALAFNIFIYNGLSNSKAHLVCKRLGWDKEQRSGNSNSKRESNTFQFAAAI